ncbi:hypothetical protein SAMN04487906_1477 [Zhouia amylolytica]|uniref:Uncharacterized protein n=2 Tax=Zhouia amylolytica TaxID=376730 RepID=W2UMU6_9FLAO|nr:hypothetical protein [Zhouia amylolytica]ETN94781.1 hypothetical protein P278_27240 [Zhouia amylolytica AD3]MCQ0110964.1 hypothetical protein [Zhouia amylolytica]SFS73360.1 hypothetical protein SAMN04487906_1477 [Zhouia amylolytica]
MKKKLEAELVNIAQRILKLEGKQDISALHNEVLKIYEKLTILKFVEEQLGSFQPTSSRQEVADKFEGLANSVLDENRHVPESNPHEGEDDLMIPGIETIKGMVQEMPEKESLDDILSGVFPQPTFIKAEADHISPDIEVKKKTETRSRSLNDRLKANSLNIGLNDKLAFVKHLFGGSTEDYNRVVSQLSTIQEWSEAQNFVENMVKPDYNNWEGKEVFADRFIEIVESKFS